MDDGPPGTLAALILAWFECQLVGEHPAGDHVLVLGKVIDGKLLDSKPSPWSIAKPEPWTAPLPCFPTLSANEWTGSFPRCYDHN